jgi:membrane fusion protein (multidrug efflux system)
MVSAGQLLFKVNDVELRAQLSQANNTRESLAAENARRAKLYFKRSNQPGRI